jgi:hypothetical protein
VMLRFAPPIAANNSAIRFSTTPGPLLMMMTLSRIRLSRLSDITVLQTVGAISPKLG